MGNGPTREHPELGVISLAPELCHSLTSQQNGNTKGINGTIPKYQSQLPKWYNYFRAVLFLHCKLVIPFPQPYNEQQAHRLLFEHHSRGSHKNPPLSFFLCVFLACLCLYVFTLPGIMYVQSNYGHLNPNTGAKQRQVLESSLQNTTDGITSAKTTHSLKATAVLRAQASQ